MMDPTVLELVKTGGLGVGILVGFYLHARAVSKNGTGRCVADQTLQQTQRTNAATTEAVKGLCVSIDRNTRAVEDQGRALLTLVQQHQPGKE